MKKIYGESPNKIILLAAAYLHDIGYSLPYQDGFIGEIEDQHLKIDVHCREGSEFARKILNDLGVESSIVDRVAYLVKEHHNKEINDEDLQLLISADKVQ